MTGRKPKRATPPAPVWAYAYAIAPPQPEARLAAVRQLLEREHSSARNVAHTWEGRLVMEPNVTHILVVSDTPDQSLEANQRLEAELRALHVNYQLTVPLAVVDSTESGSAPVATGTTKSAKGAKGTKGVKGAMGEPRAKRPK